MIWAGASHVTHRLRLIWDCVQVVTVWYPSVGAGYVAEPTPDDERPEEAHAAGTFFAAAVFLIQKGWNRLEDLGWVEAFGSDSQRAILNLDHLDPFSIRAEREGENAPDTEPCRPSESVLGSLRFTAYG